MGEVKWNARDEIGRIVEVSSDTTDMAAPPGPREVSGGEQRIRLLGPFTVAHDSPAPDPTYPEAGNFGTGSPAVVGDALPVGAVVFDAWAVLTDPFDAGGNATGITVGIADTTAVSDSFLQITSEWVSSTVAAVGDDALVAQQVAGTRTHQRAVVNGPQSKIAVVLNLADPFAALTAGECEVYVLIAEPA